MGPSFLSGASSIILSSICSIFRHRFPGNFRKTSWKFRKFTFSGWFFPPEIYFLRLVFSPEIYFLRQVFISRKFSCLIGCGLASALLITEISWEFFCSVAAEALLPTPRGMKAGPGLAWTPAPFTHICMYPCSCSASQGPDNSPTDCPAQLYYYMHPVPGATYI